MNLLRLDARHISSKPQIVDGQWRGWILVFGVVGNAAQRIERAVKGKACADLERFNLMLCIWQLSIHTYDACMQVQGLSGQPYS